MQFCKFLRLIRFSDIFIPFYKFMQFVMPWKSSFQIHDILSLLIILSAVIIIAHNAACLWIHLGHIEDDQPIENRHTWRFNNADFEDFTQREEYVFALYWVLESITTVGYGDYVGGNTNEYVATLLFISIGITFFSVMTFKMTEFAKRRMSFDE